MPPWLEIQSPELDHYRVTGHRVIGSPGQSLPGRVGSRVSFADPVPSLAYAVRIRVLTYTIDIASQKDVAINTLAKC